MSENAIGGLVFFVILIGGLLIVRHLYEQNQCRTHECETCPPRTA